MFTAKYIINNQMNTNTMIRNKLMLTIVKLARNLVEDAIVNIDVLHVKVLMNMFTKGNA